MNLVTQAREFACRAHTGQKRKYTGEPYTNHLQNVANILLDQGYSHLVVATAWLHDVVEDTPVTLDTVELIFGSQVAQGVWFLTDVPRCAGNRHMRKNVLNVQRLRQADGWIQSVKVADLIDNTASIVQHDPEFARTYLREKQVLLDVLIYAKPSLVARAKEQINARS